MIPAAHVGISDRVPDITRDLRMRLIGNAGSEIPGGVFAGVPIRVDVQIFIDGLLETELPARPV